MPLSPSISLSTHPPPPHFQETQRLTDGHRDNSNVFGPQRNLKPFSNTKFLVLLEEDKIL